MNLLNFASSHVNVKFYFKLFNPIYAKCIFPSLSIRRIHFQFFRLVGGSFILIQNLQNYCL